MSPPTANEQIEILQAELHDARLVIGIQQVQIQRLQQVVQQQQEASNGTRPDTSETEA